MNSNMQNRRDNTRPDGIDRNQFYRTGNSQPSYNSPARQTVSRGYSPNQNKQRRPQTRKKKQKSRIFRYSYIIYVALLAILIGAVLIHVNSVLNLYENEHPQKHLDNALTLLKSEAQSGELWKKNDVPSMEGGVFEATTDHKKEFVKKLQGDIRFTTPSWINENECVYGVEHDGIVIAEITLRKNGPSIKKLAIINIQKYDLVSYVPVCHTYTFEVPNDVNVDSDIFIKVNGVSVTTDMGEKRPTGETLFTLADLYSKPDVEITDKSGNRSKIRLPDSKDGKIEYDNTFYTLTLPQYLFVAVNGEKITGDAAEDGRSSYRIRLASKANVTISDLYGNSVDYTGSSSVPITYYTFMTGDNCTVKVDGQKVPDTVMEISANPEYKHFADLVTGLPRLPVYSVVVLKDNAEITITDADGKNVPFSKEETVQDLTGISSGTILESVPAEVSAEVNVIKVLEDWSLFMSCDLNFNSLSKHLIKKSYQYNVAYAYNNSIDRTFTSNHGLGTPPFVEESATNFIWLTDNCFSVDVRFVKQMIVLGQLLPDEMNERCYFLKYDDTNDGVNNPKWKLVGMKEIVDNAE